MQAIIDERADPRQREALITLLYGGETEEARTHWWVFHAMSSTVHEPLFKPFDVEIDVENRRARVSIPGVLDASRPADRQSGDRRRASRSDRHSTWNRVRDRRDRRRLFDDDRRRSRWTCSDSYGQFGHVHHTGKGVVRTRAA